MSLTLSPAPVRNRARAQFAVQPTLHQVSAVSPLVIADRLITLAKEADRAGYRGTASHLVELAYSVFDEARVH